jgi:hypothetical protein
MKSLALALAVFVVCLGTPAPAGAIEWNITQFYWDAQHEEPLGGSGGRLDGTRAVWVADDGRTDVYYDGTRLWNLNALVGGGSVGVPDISGGNVAFAQWGFHDGSYGRNQYLFSGGTVTWLAQGGMGMGDPRISGTNVVWCDGARFGTRQVYLYDGQRVTQITADDQYSKYSPQVSGANILWLGSPGSSGQSHFFLYDAQSVVQLGGTMGAVAIDAWRYAVSGTYAAWVENIANLDQVMLYDGQTTRQISQNSGRYGSVYSLRMDGERVVWDFSGDAGDQVYYYDGANVRQLRAFDPEQEPYPADYNPFVSGTNVAWNAWNEGDIMFYDGSTVTRVPGARGELLGLSGANLLWDNEGVRLGIATPEPVSLALLGAGCAALVALAHRLRKRRTTSPHAGEGARGSRGATS